MKWYMKWFLYRAADVNSSKLWINKWPSPSVIGFISQLLRASNLYHEVIGSNPVEVLTFSGFYICNCISAFITATIIAYLVHLFVLLKSLHLKFRYIPRICFVVEICLIVSTHTLLSPLISPNSTLCSR